MTSVAVLKFGGTSLSTPELRELAAMRVREALARGLRPVAVVSAMGRAPDAYATDTLLQLAGDGAVDRNADLLLSCGELISAALFAVELERNGIRATALSGAQAGIITDRSHGDASILRVDPARVQDAIDAGAVPVVAGFQGVTEDGVITTLGRGGTDLTAVAIGHALEADQVDIYTDVPGALTADPARVRGAHTIERVRLEEMAELSSLGARVMHRKAAAYAQHAGLPYAIRELRSGAGTVVDDRVAHAEPVSGVTATGEVTWFRIIRGEAGTRERRMQVELEMFARLADAGLSLDQVTINQSGVAFAIAGNRGGEVSDLLVDLNLAVRVRERCAKLSVVGAGMRGQPGVVHRVVRALSDANVEIIHCTDSHITISVLVPLDDAQLAEQAVHDEFHLEKAE